MDNLEDLRQRLHKLSSEDLLQIVRVDFAHYKTEALDLVREELQRRGYREKEIQASHVQAAKKRNMPTDPQLSRMSFLFVIAATAVITFSLFAPIVYYSVVAYGLPASIFIAAGYYIWIALLRAGSRRASAFAIAFICPVGLLLLIYSTASLRYVIEILVEFLGVCFILQLLGLRPNSGAFR